MENREEQMNLNFGPFTVERPKLLTTIPKIEVYLSYRMEARGTTPRYKAIRARILENGEPGKDLFYPMNVSIDVVVFRVIRLLHGATRQIVFRYAPELRRKDAAFDGAGK